MRNGEIVRLKAAIARLRAEEERLSGRVRELEELKRGFACHLCRDGQHAEKREGTDVRQLTGQFMQVRERAYGEGTSCRVP